MSTGSMFVAMADALGVITEVSWPYRVTFSHSTVTKGPAGGNIAGSPANSTPINVPCRYRVANSKELAFAGKTQAGVIYAIIVPNSFSDALVDVDSTSTATIAATDGGEPARTYSVIAPQRYMGLEIVVLASIES